MHELLDQLLQVGFFAALIRIATPLIFATLGELFAERAGVLNLGIEGIMMLAAMTGFSAAYFSGSLWLGVVPAALFFAVIITGAEAMSRATGVPVFLADVIQGTALVAMLVALLFTRYRIRIRRFSHA